MKTLVIISPGFPENDEDTTCLPAQQVFIQTLNSLFPDLKVIILALQYPFKKEEYLWKGNRVIPFYGMRSRFLARPFHWLHIYKRLNQIHGDRKIDGILSLWCAETALIGKLFSKRHSIVHYCWILGQDAKKQNPFVFWIRPKSDELIALSSFLLDQFFKNHKIRPQHLIPNGISPSIFKQQEFPKTIDIIGIGSLIPLKQFSFFVNVVSRVKSQIPGVRAVLCGKGPERENLEKQIRVMGLENNISVRGEVSHSQALELMQQSKILLHPSMYEGYSTVCLEALYAGCHVVSFWCGEIKPVEHWHVVNDQDQMTRACLSVLSGDTEYSPVLVHHMEDSVKAVMQLFTHKDLRSS